LAPFRPFPRPGPEVSVLGGSRAPPGPEAPEGPGRAPFGALRAGLGPFWPPFCSVLVPVLALGFGLVSSCGAWFWSAFLARFGPPFGPFRAQKPGFSGPKTLVFPPVLRHPVGFRVKSPFRDPSGVPKWVKVGQTALLRVRGQAGVYYRTKGIWQVLLRCTTCHGVLLVYVRYYGCYATRLPRALALLP